MRRPDSAPRPASTRTGLPMNRRVVSALAAVGLAASLTLAGSGVASADPVPGQPGVPPSGKTPAQIYTTVGADAFAELTNNLTVQYNAQTPAPARVLASY